MVASFYTVEWHLGRIFPLQNTISAIKRMTKIMTATKSTKKKDARKKKDAEIDE